MENKTNRGKRWGQGHRGSKGKNSINSASGLSFSSYKKWRDQIENGDEGKGDNYSRRKRTRQMSSIPKVRRTEKKYEKKGTGNWREQTKKRRALLPGLKNGMKKICPSKLAQDKIGIAVLGETAIH